jgi:hypothetical protein
LCKLEGNILRAIADVYTKDEEHWLELRVLNCRDIDLNSSFSLRWDGNVLCGKSKELVRWVSIKVQSKSVWLYDNCKIEIVDE